MQRIGSTRKARFKAALALAGISQRVWAEAHEITPEHLSMVISDVQPRESFRLETEIDEFIEKVFARVKVA
jgi:hypothetical protein